MKRVFIYSGRSLFSQGIKNLLDGVAELEVIGWETDIEVAVACIQAVQPDAILIVTKGSSDCQLSEGQRLLKAGGKAKVVELNLEDSNVCVYSGERLTIKEVGDLVRAIEEPVPVSPGGSIDARTLKSDKENSAY